MAFQIDPGRPPGELIPLENQVPDQGSDGLRAMLPLAPAREQQNHDIRQHAGLGHGQHDQMETQNTLPEQNVVDLEQNDGMLEDGSAEPRGQTENYFSVFPTSDAQAAQLSNYIRRPNCRTPTCSVPKQSRDCLSEVENMFLVASSFSVANATRHVRFASWDLLPSSQ